MSILQTSAKIWESPEIEKRRAMIAAHCRMNSSISWFNVHLFSFFIFFIELNFRILFFLWHLQDSWLDSHDILCKGFFMFSFLMMVIHLYNFYTARGFLNSSKYPDKIDSKVTPQNSPQNANISLYLPSANRHNHPTTHYGPSMFESPGKHSTPPRTLGATLGTTPLAKSSPLGRKAAPMSVNTSAYSPANFNLSDYLPRTVQDASSMECEPHLSLTQFPDSFMSTAMGDQTSSMNWSRPAVLRHSWTGTVQAGGSFQSTSPGQMGSGQSPPHPSMGWTGHGDADVSNVRRWQYQLATPPPQKSSLPNGVSGRPKEDPELSADQVWQNLKVAESEIEQWSENLRKWIHGTIVRRIVDEIRAINLRLKEFGHEDMTIGEASIESLRQLASTRSQYLPTLPTLIPFLDCTKEQRYLVHRLEELYRGGCLGEFLWSAGSRSEKLPWKEHLPNDSLIILHLFTTYMDTRLPAHPKCFDGRTFSQLHVVRSPEKLDTDSKDGYLIYQASTHPPHFKLVVDGAIWDIAAGRKNLFHAILLFLYQIKTKNNGILRRISLGRSGVNILWIFGGDDPM